MNSQPAPDATEQHQVAVAVDALKGSYQTAQEQRGKNDRKSLKYARLSSRAAVVYTILTAVLLGFGFYSAIQTTRSVEAANKSAAAAKLAANAALASLRAWVAPIRFRLLNPIDPARQAVTVVVDALNVGKQPAIGVVSVAAVDAAAPDQIRDKHACRNVAPSPGEAIVYPSDRFGATLSYARDFSKQPGTITNIISGKEVLFIMGCIAYETLGSPHHSEYCSYLYPELGPQTGVEAAKPIAEWQFRSCPVGNEAN